MDHHVDYGRLRWDPRLAIRFGAPFYSPEASMLPSPNRINTAISPRMKVSSHAISHKQISGFFTCSRAQVARA